ncbi:MAG: hypothetical protein ABEJ42_06225 [Halobacteriaceae archaeon]
MRREALRFVDLLFERDGIVQGLVTAMFVLASEYWMLVLSPNELSTALAFSVIAPLFIVVYAYWDTLEAGFEERFLERS